MINLRGLVGMGRFGVTRKNRYLENFQKALSEIVGYLRGYVNGTIMRDLERRRTEEGQVKEHC